MKRKILIVDDSLTNTILLATVLDKEGYETESSLSVKDALDIIHQNIPDLILLDLHMPESSGYELMNYLRDSKQFEDIPVMLVSADDQELSSEHPTQMGAIGCIKKPVNIDFLLEMVQKQFNTTSHVNS